MRECVLLAKFAKSKNSRILPDLQYYFFSAGINTRSGSFNLSISPRWGRARDQAVLTTPSAPRWGRARDQAVLTTPSAPRWGRARDQAVLTTPSAPRWGRARDQAVLTTP